MNRIVLLVIIALCLFGCEKKELFYLSEEYYGTGEVAKTSSAEINVLEETKKSFAVLIYSNGCTACSKFDYFVTTFATENNIKIYSMAVTDIDGTKMGEYIKYSPSVVLYKDGEIFKFLDAEADEDLKYYNSIEGFTSWFKENCYLKK